MAATTLSKRSLNLGGIHFLPTHMGSSGQLLKTIPADLLNLLLYLHGSCCCATPFDTVQIGGMEATELK
jgi:hypothetical protein